MLSRGAVALGYGTGDVMGQSSDLRVRGQPSHLSSVADSGLIT